MEWFKIYVKDLANRLLAVDDDAAVGAWVRLLAKCYDVENSGVFEHCADYSTRKWLTIAGVDREAVDRVVAAGLAAWDGDDLQIDGFDVELQEKATARTRQNRELANRKWEKVKAKAKADAEAKINAEGEGEKEKETEGEIEEEIEGEGIAKGTARGNAKGIASARVEGSEAFRKFWESYPRRVSKGQAIKAWPGDELLPSILAALEWQAPHWRATDREFPQHVPHPSTYLNGRRWEDEKPAATPTSRNVRVGIVRAEDCRHEITGEVKL